MCRYVKIKENLKKRVVKHHVRKTIHFKLISWLIVQVYV